MVRRFLPVALATASALVIHHQAAVSAESAALAIGAGMPGAGATLRNVDGRVVTLADLRGEKGTLVIFSCNACPWAKKWETRIVALGNEYAKRGIGVAVVNSNDPAVNQEDSFEVMQARAKERGMAFPYLHDATSELARAFGAQRTPEVFLFDAAGKMVFHGAVDDNANEPAKVEAHYLRDALASLVAGREIAMKETKALGCTIKFHGKDAVPGAGRKS